MGLFKNHRFISGAISIVLAFSLFGGATLAQASTLTTAQIYAITSLLQAFNVDSGTIANVQAVLENQGTTTQQSYSFSTSTSSGASNQSQSGNNCSVLSGTLQPGSTDQSTHGEISRLQSFLGKDRSIYPEDAITGYFGSSTLQAVQRWQAAHGIVSSGSPTSTGFGEVGPRTRGEMDKEMEMECEQGDSQNSSDHTTASSTPEHASGSGDSTDHATTSASSTPSQNSGSREN